MPCRYFNGSNQSISFSGGGWPPGDSSNLITLACWIKVPAIGTAYSLMSIGRDGQNEYASLYLQSTGTVSMESRRSSATIGTATTTSSIIPGQWVFVCGTVASVTDRKVYLYQNGYWETAGNTTSVTGASSASVTTRYGESAGGSPGSDFVGFMAYPTHMSRALSFDLIRLLAFNPHFYRRENQTSTYYLEGMNPERDYDGVNNGTLNGTPVPIWNDGPPIVDFPSPRNKYKKPIITREPIFSFSGDWINSFILSGAIAAPPGGGSAIYTMCLMGV